MQANCGHHAADAWACRVELIDVRHGWVWGSVIVA